MNRLKELRTSKLDERGKPLTGAKVSKLIGCDPTTYSLWEQGKTQLQKIEFAKKLSDLYGVSIDYLLGFDPYRKSENENICEQLGLSEGAVEKLRGTKIEVPDGEFVHHEIDNDLLSFILESDYGDKLLQAVEMYIQSIPGHNSSINIDGVYGGNIVLTDMKNLNSNIPEADTLRRFLKEEKEKGHKDYQVVYAPWLSGQIEAYTKEEISKALYELKKEYEGKENDGKDS